MTEGLLEKHGPDRVIDTPISEMGFLGAAVGAAVCGMKPVAEMMFVEFTGVALDALTTEAATMRYLSRGQFTVPMVMRASAGAGQGFGCQHSQMLDHWFRGTPGLKVCVPSGSRTAYGLLRSAIEDPDPVVVLEPRVLYGEREEFDGDPAYRVPLGKAEIVAEGKDVTVLTAGRWCGWCSDAAAMTKASVEVIDLLSLWPWDEETVTKSVGKTGRLVTVEEAPAGTGWGGHDGVDHPRHLVRRVEGAAAPHHAPRCADPLQRHAGSALSPQSRVCRRADRRAGHDRPGAAGLVEGSIMNTLINSERSHRPPRRARPTGWSS